MSGLVVVVERAGGPAPIESARASLAELAHRGPDGLTDASAGPAALGHALFATTHEDRLDAQPLASACGRRWIVADARLDNRAELLEQRRRAGVAGAASDAALILWAYETWGSGCPTRLLGDFAFAIWDGDRREVLCARDHLGVRPLYFQADARRFRCASEPHALFADGEVTPRPHALSVALLMLAEYRELGQTLYEGVFSLPPAHTLTVSERGLRQEAYWAPDAWREIRLGSPGEYAEAFGALLTEAVRCRLRSAGRIGVQVSGGFDSSSVAGVVETLRRAGAPIEPPVLMRLTYPDLPCDETPYSDAVAAHWGLPMVSAEAFPPGGRPGNPDPSALPPDVHYDLTMIGMCPVLDAGRAHGARVHLTGLGADQLLWSTGAECEDHLRRFELARAARLARPGALARAAVRAFVPEPVQALVRRARGRGPVVPDWIAPAVARDIEAHRAEEAARAGRERFPSRASRRVVEVLLAGTDVVLALAGADRIAARAGVECRHPFYDRRLVDFMLSIPDEQRTGSVLSKPLLRRAMESALPVAVRERVQTTDFTCYVHRALSGEHRETLRGLLGSRSCLAGSGLVNMDRVASMLAAQSELHLNEVSALARAEFWLRQPLLQATSVRPARTRGPA